MSQPTTNGWNFVLRFGLELGALAGLGLQAWRLTAGPVRYAAVVAVPIAAAAMWGVCLVLEDPSRSGRASGNVDGWTRIAIETAILSGGAIAVAYAGGRDISIAFAVLIAAHYAASRSRLVSLIQQ